MHLTDHEKGSSHNQASRATETREIEAFTRRWPIALCNESKQVLVSEGNQQVSSKVKGESHNLRTRSRFESVRGMGYVKPHE